MEPKSSHLLKEEIPIIASGHGYEGRFIEWGGFVIAFEKWLEDLDETNMFKDFPGGRCPCPHWGYLFKGKMTVRYNDHEESIGAGEAYYLKPGHNSIITKGTESMEVSPKREYEEAINAIKDAQSTNH